MIRAIGQSSMAHRWRRKICAVIEISLGEGMAQKSAPLAHAAVAHRWRNLLRARIPFHPLCAIGALPSATLEGARYHRAIRTYA